MSTVAVIVIIIVVVVLAAAAVVAASELRRVRMRRQFGPEYDRMAKELGRRKADAELAARQRRVADLGIHPLTAEQQASYVGDWTAVQERFVDAPAQAVTEAGKLIWDVMRDRGYPADDADASMEALSVNHGRLLDGYRQARDVDGRADSASTEELREAMIRYRTLFDDLLGVSNGALDRREAGARTADTPR
jgi:cytochrome c556